VSLPRGGREALWSLGLSVLVHAGLVTGLGSIVLASSVRIQPAVLEVAVVAAAEAPPAPTSEAAASVLSAPPAETAAVPPPAPPDPPPAPSGFETPDAALAEARPDATASAPAEPRPPAPREAPRRPAARQQLAVKPPALPSASGVDGITNAKPTELSAAASFKPIVAPPLTYPPVAIALGEEGTVGLLVEIDLEGTPTAVTVEKSSGFGSLDEEAIRTMLRWRFSPPTKNGHASAVTIYIPMVFKLKHHDGRGAP
jgi:periplasmic protein TonB